MAEPGGNGNGSGMEMAPQQGPPYAPTTAALGGQPTVQVDDPICAVLFVLYVVAAATNMVIFQINRRRDHKFIFSVLLFGFSMARLTTLALRMGWASHPRDINLAIAATIFVQAGVLILFMVNLLFTQRMVRSYHPNFGWSRALGLAFKFLYFCIIAMLIMVITASVYAFFTLNVATRLEIRTIQLVAGTFLAILAFLPIPITAITLLTRPTKRRPEKFGIGRYRTKLSLLFGTATLLSLGACFRIGIAYLDPRPIADPAWYDSKACFYCFNFVIELVVVYAYTISRFDRRFHVPDGSAGPGHYSSGRRPGDLESIDVSSPRRKYSGDRGLHSHGRHNASSATLAVASRSMLEVNRESEIFGDPGSPTSVAMQKRLQAEWEASALQEMQEEAENFPSTA